MPTTLETRPLKDFLEHPDEHLTRLRASRQPELLTEEGQDSLVVLVADAYDEIVRRLENVEAVAETRARFAELRAASGEHPRLTDAERAHRHELLDELTAESQRLGLYK